MNSFACRFSIGAHSPLQTRTQNEETVVVYSQGTDCMQGQTIHTTSYSLKSRRTHTHTYHTHTHTHTHTHMHFWLWIGKTLTTILCSSHPRDMHPWSLSYQHLHSQSQECPLLLPTQFQNVYPKPQPHPTSPSRSVIIKTGNFCSFR